EGIRNFMRTSPPQREVVDLYKLIQDVLALLEGDLRKQKINIEINSPQEPVLVHGDTLQISQVLLNLLRNALDSVAQASGHRVLVACEQSEQRGRLSVRDWGAGISDAHHAQVGTPFFTTKPQGLGMGLAISHTIVRNHSGTLSLDNAQDGQGPGALAVLDLPLAQTQARA
ncbi:MAG: sensor histidine kinase, partial [Rhodoferax sp.]|nr:sensor histidine kinase [Rhodoferax sp.]